MVGPLHQRIQYAKGGIGKRYWDYRDKKTLAYIGKEEDILDIGCGEGVTLEKLVKKFPDRTIKGIDYSWENVEVCKEYNLPAEVGDVYQLNFPDNTFDCCLFMEVIEHLEKPLRALKEIYRILRPGGLLLIVFPNDIIFKISRIVCLKFKEAFTPSGHLKQWSPQEMRKVLRDIGFSIFKMEYLPFSLWLCSLHCLVACRKIKKERKNV